MKIIRRGGARALNEHGNPSQVGKKHVGSRTRCTPAQRGQQNPALYLQRIVSVKADRISYAYVPAEHAGIRCQNR